MSIKFNKKLLNVGDFSSITINIVCKYVNDLHFKKLKLEPPKKIFSNHNFVQINQR